MHRFSSRFLSTVVPAVFVCLLATAGACGSSEGDEDDAGPQRDGGRKRDAATSSSSSGESSSSSSSGGSSSSSGGSSSGGSSSSSSGASCNDPDDAQDMLSPKQLPPISDGDDNISDIEGVISTGDEDAYQRLVTDDWFGSVGPLVSTVAPNVQLCMFLECNSGGQITINDCTNGSVQLKYSDTRIGCCGTSVGIKFDCPGTDDSLQTFVRVRSTADQCEPYTLNFGQ